MHIKQVVIRGFKTYKEQTALDEEFSPGANVVVGFNGSGKSNFYQAILFVLSDHFSTLRTETRKALLHEGTGQQVLTAFVEVILENTDRRIPVESDQVSIRRHIGMKKDDWLLDGRHATKSEIFGLLEAAGFSKSSPYYIVQQGKVSELTLMSDTQRLGLLKEISGAGVYDERRAESMKLMEDTLMRRTRTETVIGEIQQKLGALEGDQRELRECERLETRRRTLEYVLADRDWRIAQDSIEELEQKRTDLSNKLVGLQGELGRARSSKQEGESKQSTIAEEMQRLQEQLQAAVAARDAKYEVLLKARLDTKEASSQQRRSEELNAERVEDLQRARAELARATEEIGTARPQVEAAQQRVNETEQACQVARAKRDQLMARQARGQQYKTVQDRNDALQQEIHKRTAQLKEGRRKLTECEERLQRVRDRGIQADQEVVEKRERVAASDERLNSLSGDIRRVGAQLDQTSERVRLLHQERGQASQSVDRLRRDVQSSQHRLEGTMPRAYRHGLHALMAWVQEKNLHDRLPGPLIRHIEVPSTFRAAVESFAGMALFNVLAMDDEIAAEAVKMVRTKGAGHIVVTPLNQLRHRTYSYPKLDGVKPLVDVIRCPEWAALAVQQVFGNAVVCRSMELCEEVARNHGIDAITLDGDRVSRKGVVTGGYQDPQRFARLASAENARESVEKLQAAEAKLPQLKENIQEASVQLDELHTQQRKLQEDRESVRADLVGLTESIRSLEAEIAKAGRDRQDLEEWKQRMQVAVSQHEVSIEAKKLEMQSKSLSGLGPEDEKTLEDLTAELKDLQAMSEAQTTEHRTLRLALEEKEAALESFFRKRVNELEMQVVGGLQDGSLDHSGPAVAMQACSRLEREHHEMLTSTEELSRQIEALTSSSNDAKQSTDEAVKQEQHLQEEVAALGVRLDKVTADLTAQSQRRGEVDARLKVLTAAPAEVEACRAIPKPQLVRDLAQTNRELQMYEHVNRKAVEQFENFSEQLTDLKRRKKDIDEGELAIENAIKIIDEQKEATMMKALEQVNTHLQHVFSELVPGGMARLRVVHQNEPAASDQDGTTAVQGRGDVVGVKTEVSFTGQAQSYLSMSQLSGGQKTVVALSLIFAIQRLDPAPFYLLDEVDAALDASYRSALANLIARTAQSSQVILTTFRPEAIERADKCYRVYQQNRASRIDVVTREQAKQVITEQDRLSQAAAS